MKRSRKPIRIAARTSELARAQAALVGQMLARLHPQLEILYHWIESEADQAPTAVLAQVGGKGLFTRAIDQAVLDDKADLAVHSLKDLPVATVQGLSLVAVPPRADVRDVLITREPGISLQDLPQAAVVGTSSMRRAAQLQQLRPDLTIRALRGNVPTRLAALQQASSGLDAIVLAMAGLERLGLAPDGAMPLAVETMLPAAGQGALAVHCRTADHVSMTRCLPLNHAPTATAVNAEREVLAALGADCHSCIAVHAQPTASPITVRQNADAHWFRLRVQVLSHDGQRQLASDDTIRTRSLYRQIRRTVADLKDRGAVELMRG